MYPSINRRNWLKTSVALASGFVTIPSLAHHLMSAPASKAEKIFFDTVTPPSIKIRLGSNENPYGPSDKARKAVMDILSEGNRYPFQTVVTLKEFLAGKEGVTPDHIAVGAGSADLLCAAGAGFGIEGKRIVAANPTFPMLMNYAEVFNATWDKVNVNEKLEHDYEAMASAIKSDTSLVFVCNPNNPTGTLVDPQRVKAFCEDVSKRVPIFADEAYQEFLDPSQQLSMIGLVKQGKNVVVSRTFSKIYGLAGFRIGYIIAPPDLIKKISRYQPGIPNNQPAIAAAIASYGDTGFMDLSRKKNAAARKHLTDYLDKKKLFYGKSHANFVFFEAPMDGQTILSKLSEQGIGIRIWDYNNKQWCRVSIGTIEEMQIFTRAFEGIMS